jgi:serine/threonine protein kinase
MDARQGMRFGDWLLVQRLGGGAYGEVWSAVHAVLERRVALKLGTSDVATDRLVSEARAQYGLEHPGIVRVHDVVSSHRPAYIVMELIEGATLRQLLRERGRLEVPDAAAVLRQVMDALEHAHARGVIHGDLKPENILVETGPEGGRAAGWRVRLTDFQLGRADTAAEEAAARASEPEDGIRQSLVTRTALGTAHYMAPEQERPGRGGVDHRVDIYAVGVLLFEMLTGSLPQGRDLPSDVNPAVSWWWDHIYSRCYTGRERRYGSLAALRRDIEAMADGPRWGELPSQRQPDAAVAVAVPVGKAVASGQGRSPDDDGAFARALVAGRAARQPARRRRRFAAFGGAALACGMALPVMLAAWMALAPGDLRRTWRCGPRADVAVMAGVGEGTSWSFHRDWNDGRYRVRVVEDRGDRRVYIYRQGEREPLRTIRLDGDGTVDSRFEAW